MEFVVVAYPAHREVCIDGQPAGFTNVPIRVDRGHHMFDLGTPLDYRPAFLGRAVQSTTILDPLVISDFTQVTVSVV